MDVGPHHLRNSTCCTSIPLSHYFGDHVLTWCSTFLLCYHCIPILISHVTDKRIIHFAVVVTAMSLQNAGSSYS
ncbi:MAG: hypothetical protein ACRDL7_12980, partial [Gaiellaceae bacterium]